MKKLMYFLCTLCIGFTCLFPLSSVKAETIVTRVDLIEPNVWVRFPMDNGYTFNTILGYVFGNEKLMYCVEPYKLVDSNIEMNESSLLTKQQKDKLSLISYNGYHEKERKSDKWYMATQLMIWEALGHYPKVEGFDEYASYKEKINQNIAKFNALPSFDGQQVTLKKGEEVILDDKNEVFSSFKNNQHEGNAQLEKKDHQLRLSTQSNKRQEGSYTYQKLMDEEVGLPIVYSAADSNVQSIIYPKISQNVKGKITYRVEAYGQVKFMKSGNQVTGVHVGDSEDGKVYSLQYGEAPLKNVEASIYAREDIVDTWGHVVHQKDSFIETLNSSEYVQSKQLLAGKYYLQEIKTQAGYVLDTKAYDFVISKEQEELDIQTITLHNKRAKVDLQIQKVFEEGSLLDLREAYQDVVIGIYTKTDINMLDGTQIVPAGALMYRGGIDEQGHLLDIVDLPLGSYYLQELHTNEHFVLDATKYDFNVQVNGAEVIPVIINQGMIENKLHRNELKIFKHGEKQKPLQATFVLYDATMQELETFTTNEHGEYVFIDLVDGDYFLQEVEAPKGYKLNNKIHKLSIKEDMEYKIENEKHVISPSVETKDTKNHKVFEVSMVASMVAMYSFIFRKFMKM